MRSTDKHGNTKHALKGGGQDWDREQGKQLQGYRARARSRTDRNQVQN